MSACFLLVDDHALFRAGLRALLATHFPEVACLETGDGEGAIARARELNPDLIILDLHLPDRNGLDVARQILDRSQPPRILILSAEADLSFAVRALQEGVCGYLLKSCVLEQLVEAIRAVLAGRLYVCPEANAAVLEYCRQNLAAKTRPRPPLSGRELQVLRSVADGLRTKEIAAQLDLGVKTVETYRRRLGKKLACRSNAELVRYALRNGFVQP